MNRWSIVFTCLLLALQSATPLIARQHSWEQLGDHAYAGKQFDSALNYYTEAISSSDPDAILWYKTGNTHFRLHHLGLAAYSYVKALKLNPGFTEALENLEHIQTLIQPKTNQNPVFAIRLWRNFTRVSNSNFLALVALIFISVPIVLIAVNNYRTKQLAKKHRFISALSISVGMCFAVLASAAVLRNSFHNTGIIIRANAPLQSEIKASNKTPTINLPEGLLVKVVGKNGNLIKVELQNGRSGFVQSSDIATIE